MEIFLFILSALAFTSIYLLNRYDKKIEKRKEAEHTIHIKQPPRPQASVSHELHENAKTKQSSLNKHQKLEKAIKEGKSVTITYCNYDGENSKRRLSNLEYNNEFDGYNQQHIKAFCHKRNEERSFRIGRIESIELN